MRKSELALGTLLLLSVFASSVFILQSTRSDEAVAANSDIYKQLDLFGDVLERVRSEYVEKPDDTKLIEYAINGMLSGLDPHSSYLTPKDFQDMQVQTRGEFGGLGIEVTMEEGVIKVISPIENTPAERAGILSGDLITHLDGESIQGLTLSEAVDRMRGPVDSPITLTVLRKGAAAPFQKKINRDIVRVNPVRHNVEGKSGYIRVKSFQSEQTSDYVKQAVEDMKRTLGKDLNGYILDLRNNPGGLLDQAIAVSDAFLDKGSIVLTKGRNASETQRSNSRPGDITDGKPVIVLINGGSASASEIVAGALQDHKRAQVVGSRSFGKGSVQTMIPLGGNGGIRLTTARYYTPAGRSIQATGIEPDHKVEQELPDEMKQLALIPRGEASLRGHLKSEGEEENGGSPSYVPKEKEKDVQLKYALDMLNGVIPMDVKKWRMRLRLQRPPRIDPAVLKLTIVMSWPGFNPAMIYANEEVARQAAVKALIITSTLFFTLSGAALIYFVSADPSYEYDMKFILAVDASKMPKPRSQASPPLVASGGVSGAPVIAGRAETPEALLAPDALGNLQSFQFDSGQKETAPNTAPSSAD